jgi:hypothetical protein
MSMPVVDATVLLDKLWSVVAHVRGDPQLQLAGGVALVLLVFGRFLWSLLCSSVDAICMGSKILFFSACGVAGVGIGLHILHAVASIQFTELITAVIQQYRPSKP